MIIDIECPLCSGEGEVIDGRRGCNDELITCPRCDGTGTVLQDLNEDADDE